MNSGTKLIVAGVLAIFAAVGLYYGFAPQSSTAGPKPPTGVTATAPSANRNIAAAPKSAVTPPTTPTAGVGSGAPGSGSGAPSAPPVGPRPAPGPVVDPLSRSAERPVVDPTVPATSGGKGDAPSTPPGASPTAPVAPASTPATTPTASPSTNPGSAAQPGGTANPGSGVGSPGAVTPTNPPVVSPPSVPANGTGLGPKPVTPLGPTTPPKLPAGETTHVVTERETMSSIAEKYYGDRNKWQLIAKANPLIDPKGMKLGTKLVIPADAPKAATTPTTPAAKPTVPAVAPASVTANTASGEKLHTVAAGETLMAIARDYYGSAGLWDIIYEANKAAIGDEPESLKAGIKLVIPKKPS